MSRTDRISFRRRDVLASESLDVFDSESPGDAGSTGTMRRAIPRRRSRMLDLMDLSYGSNVLLDYIFLSWKCVNNSRKRINR